MPRSRFALTEPEPPTPPRRGAPLIGVLAVTALLALTAVLIGSAVANLGLLNALHAAGLQGVEPAGAGPFKALVGTLTQNAVWFIVTGVGLVLTIVVGLLALGSRNAPDVLFRVIAGIAALMIGIPGLLA